MDLISGSLGGLWRMLLHPNGQQKGHNLCKYVGLRPLTNFNELLIGAGDRNRTGRDFTPADFRHTTFFNAKQTACSCAGLCLHHGAMHCRCPPSSLYTFLFPGLARRCLGHLTRGFTEFEGIHQALSLSGAQFL